MARNWYRRQRRADSFVSEHVFEWRGIVAKKNGTWRAYLIHRTGENMISPGIYKTMKDAKDWCNLRLTEIHERQKLAAEHEYKQALAAEHEYNHWYRDEMRRTRRSQDSLQTRRDKLDGSSDGRMYRDGGKYGSSISFDAMDDESDS